MHIGFCIRQFLITNQQNFIPNVIVAGNVIVFNF